MMKTWKHALTFTVDAQAGSTHRETMNLDGVDYEINVSPAGPLQQLRQGKRVLKEDRGLGGFEKDAISLGPRGGGCPCCQR